MSHPVIPTIRRTPILGLLPVGVHPLPSCTYPGLFFWHGPCERPPSYCLLLFSGSDTVKVDPCPSSLVTVIVPP